MPEQSPGHGHDDYIEQAADHREREGVAQADTEQTEEVYHSSFGYSNATEGDRESGDE